MEHGSLQDLLDARRDERAKAFDDLLNSKGNITYQQYSDYSIMFDRNERPGTLAALYESGRCEPSELAAMIADAWTLAEYPAQCLEPDYWEFMFSDAGYHGLSGELLKRPCEPVTLFRGASIGETVRGFGMSWTVNREQAQWFADRNMMLSEDEQAVFKAEIPSWLLLADYREQDRRVGRGEGEIVVLPFDGGDVPVSIVSYGVNADDEE